MSLKEKIDVNHRIAENTVFAKYLISGDVSKEIYSDFLFNRFMIYSEIEKLSEYSFMSLINRENKIFKDYTEIRGDIIPIVFLETKKYIEYIRTLSQKDLLAHIYVRYFGDMYGGSIIAKNVPGSATMYDFPMKSEAIREIRSKLDESYAEEANKCFEYIIKQYEEITYVYDLEHIERTEQIVH
jgi:heme oxygenase